MSKPPLLSKSIISLIICADLKPILTLKPLKEAETGAGVAQQKHEFLKATCTSCKVSRTNHATANVIFSNAGTGTMKISSNKLK